ncbi:glycosyltransferase family 4 protein [Patescibacteria group bacterium]|nr:glycosyltransferase family 4 protein [Patescibacteria group bacterium]
MKLLMITRKVDRDDAQAGFTYGWVKKFALNVEVLKVICLEKGNLEGLPDNVEVFSLGKEKGKNRFREFINFQRGALRFIREVDGVFCHQNPEYTILIAPYAKIFRKKTVTWYSHKEINWKVRLINILADKIVTPTQEGFGLESKKKNVVGHGIDTDLFRPAVNKKKRDVFRIISIGRISPIKDYKTLIKAVDILRSNQKFTSAIKVSIIGSPGLPSQQSYFDEIKQIIHDKKMEDIFEFKGAIPNQELYKYCQESDLSVNLCPTGSPDKAVLESMACGLPVLVCNKTFIDDFSPYADLLIFNEKDPIDLSEKVFNLAQSDKMEEIGKHLRKQSVQNHNLDNLVLKIINVFKEIS